MAGSDAENELDDAGASDSPRRQRLDPAERRESLLDLGIELFGERPYEVVEVSEICERAGISRALFYHYFGSKKSFYLGTVKRAVSTVHDLTRPDDAGRALDDMTQKIEAWLDFVREHPEGAMVAVQRRVGSGEEFEALFEPFRQRTHRMLIATVGEENLDPLVDLAIWTWQDLVESVAMRLIDKPEVTTPDAASFTMLALCNLLEEAFAKSGRPLPAHWRATQASQRGSKNAGS